MKTGTMALVACIALLAACTDPKSTVLPADLSKIDSIQPQLQKLTDEEKTLFAGYAMRKVMKGTMFGGMAGNTEAATIGQAIDNQREFVAAAKKRDAEEKALKAKLEAERATAMKALREVVTVALVSKKVEIERGYSGIEMDRKISVTVGYKNNGAKDIAGVKGRLVVKDLFGDDLSAFRISNDETIKAGGSVTWTGGRSMKYAMGNQKDEKFADLPDDKFKVEWEPETIVFTDGTRLTVPQ